MKREPITVSPQEWVDALESGKYKKARGGLMNKSGNGFCCLGVLCDIAGKDKKAMSDHGMIPYEWTPEWAGRPWDDFDRFQDQVARVNDHSAGFDKAIAMIKEKFLNG